MKKRIFTALGIALVAFPAFFAGSQVMRKRPHTHNRHFSQCKVISLTEFNKKMLEDFFNGKTPDIIMECPQGLNLPFSITLKGDFLDLESKSEIPPYMVKIVKKCFIRNTGETILFSADLKNWKEFMQFFTGSIGVAIDDKTPQAILNMELNERK